MKKPGLASNKQSQAAFLTQFVSVFRIILILSSNTIKKLKYNGGNSNGKLQSN